jgi:hypothetical protein
LTAVPVQNQIIAVFGRKGSGKTTLVQRYLAKVRRFVVADSLAEYTVGTVYHDLRDFARAAKRAGAGKLQAVVRIGDDEAFDTLSAMVRVIGEVAPVLYVIEEADIQCSPQYIPDSMDRLVRYGRHWRVSLLVVSRRPAEISRHLTAQADTIVAFQTFEPRDLDFFRARCGGDFAESIAGLKRYTWRVWGEPLTRSGRARRLRAEADVDTERA